MRGVRLSHRPLRSYGLPEAARPLAAKAIREARRLSAIPIEEVAPHRNSEDRDLRGYLHSVGVLTVARDLAQQYLELCVLDEDPAEFPPEHEGLWFHTAVAIDNRLGVHGLSLEDAG
jgi:hypothetical protein